MRRSFLPLISLLIACYGLNAQLTPDDYKRADTIRNLNKLVTGDDVRPHWIDSTNIFWYSVTTSRGTEYFLVDPVKLKKNKAFDQEKLARAFNKASGNSMKPFKMDLGRLSFSDNLRSIEFTRDNARWKCDLKKYTVEKVESIAPREKNDHYWGESSSHLENDAKRSPDGKWIAFIRSYNLYVKDQEGKEEFQLSFDGSEGDRYSSDIRWSPDSKKLATNQVRMHEKTFFYLVESSPSDQLQPRLHKREYLKPGDAVPIYKPRLFDLASKSRIDFDTRPFEDQFYLNRIDWRKDSRAFTFEYNRRGHQVYQVVEVDANSGKVKVLIDEQSKTFIHYHQRTRIDLNDGAEILWASERDGWNHLYLVEGNSGEIRKQVTKGEWVVRKLIHVDEKERWLLFEASGLVPGEDPYLRHVCRINLDGTGLVILTPENGNHTSLFSHDHSFFVDTWSRVDLPPVSVLRKGTDGEVIMELETADITSLLEAGYQVPEVFSAKGRDGITDIWGLIYRPVNFDENKTYPVIESIYAGPHGSHVPKNFMGLPGYANLAELGFIIVQIDGMGTANRSKAFHDVCWRNLKDAGFPDRIPWIRTAAEKYSYMDTTRVGIFGTSAGGQSSTGALLFHPGFYDVAVSSCGCHDNRMDKIWWNEQWMGYPVGPEYADNSNVTHASNLKGQLMLLLGEMDDNVDPSSTRQLADALIKANKEFEFVLLPGLNHTSGGKYGDRKRIDFFVKHLHGYDPPRWNKVGSF